MVSETKIYKIKDIIRYNEFGILDYVSSLAIIHKVAAIASYHTDHNILIDLRLTTIKEQDFQKLLELSMEMVRHKKTFKNKIANVIPDDEERLEMAMFFKSLVDLRGLDYKFFTDFEEAMDWLSDSISLNKEN